MTGPSRRVAVLGAGVAGLTCARILQEACIEVMVFDKGFKSGGRLATRRSPLEHQFDHGAQYMTAVDHRFQQAMTAWHEAGWVLPWQGRIVRIEHDGQITHRTRTHWVAVPGMNHLAHQLGAGLVLHTGWTVTGLAERSGLWWLLGAHDDAGPFTDELICTPAPQALALVTPHQPEFTTSLSQVVMMPCWAVMVAFERMPEVSYEAAHIIGRSPLGWIANNASKPGRKSDPCWVLHANARWSEDHLEAEPHWVIAQLLAEWESQLGNRLPAVTEAIAHRWRYARATKPLGVPSAYDRLRHLGVAGDWCIDQKVEAAYLSGADLAQRVLMDIAR